MFEKVHVITKSIFEICKAAVTNYTKQKSHNAMQGISPAPTPGTTPKSVVTPGSVDPNFDYSLCTQVCQWPGDAETPRVSVPGIQDEAITEIVSEAHGRFPLKRGNTVVGRDPSASSDDHHVLKIETTSMSRSHAMFEITKHGSVWEICFQDKGSLNGCRIGTRPLQINRFYEIKHGQVIHLGLEKFKLEICEKFRPPSTKTPAKSPFARSISRGLDLDALDGPLDGQRLQEGDIHHDEDEDQEVEMPSTQCYIDAVIPGANHNQNAPQQENLPNFGNANMMATQQYACETETEMPATQAYAIPETLPQNVLQQAQSLQNTANTMQSTNMMPNTLQNSMTNPMGGTMTNPMANTMMPNTMTNTMPFDHGGTMPATQAYAGMGWRTFKSFQMDAFVDTIFNILSFFLRVIGHSKLFFQVCQRHKLIRKLRCRPRRHMRLRSLVYWGLRRRRSSKRKKRLRLRKNRNKNVYRRRWRISCRRKLKLSAVRVESQLVGILPVASPRRWTTPALNLWPRCRSHFKTH